MFSPIFTYLYYFPLQAWGTILAMAFIIYISFKIFKKLYESEVVTKERYISLTLLVIYLLILLYITFLGRRSLDYHRYNWDFGWSYIKAFTNHDMSVLKEIIFNIIMFIPLGIIGEYAFKKMRCFKTLMIGVGTSATIELMQYYMRRGLTEYDDILSNGIGLVIGIIIGLIMRAIIYIIRRYCSHISKK